MDISNVRFLLGNKFDFCKLLNGVEQYLGFSNPAMIISGSELRAYLMLSLILYVLVLVLEKASKTLRQNLLSKRFKVGSLSLRYPASNVWCFLIAGQI